MDYNTIFWKTKAVQRNADNKALKKRIAEIIEGRDNWKKKYHKSKDETEKYKKEINFIKKKIEKIFEK
jgi:peptidoglycan hydrolase CwlO-like protein